MNTHEKVVFERLVELADVNPQTVEKILTLLGPVIAEQLGKGKTCKIPGFTSIVPTDALSKERVDYEDRRCIRFSVDNGFIERVYQSYWDEPDDIITEIEEKKERARRAKIMREYKKTV